MWSQQRPDGSSSRLATRLTQSGLWWILKTMLGPVIPFGLAALAIALVAVLLPLAFVQGAGPETAARTEVAVAIQRNSPAVLSFDGTERGHQMSRQLATAVLQQAWQEGRHVTAQAVVAALSPRFMYEAHVLTSLRRVPRETEPETPDGDEITSDLPDQEPEWASEWEPESEPGPKPGSELGPEPEWEEVRTDRIVQAVSLAETYRRRYRYEYRVQRYEYADGWDEHLERVSVTVTEEPGRFVATLADLLGRQVEPWEAAWLEGLAADVDGDHTAAGQWLLRPQH